MSYQSLIGCYLDDELVGGHPTMLQHQSGHIGILRSWFCGHGESIFHMLLWHVQQLSGVEKAWKEKIDKKYNLWLEKWLIVALKKYITIKQFTITDLLHCMVKMGCDFYTVSQYGVIMGKKIIFCACSFGLKCHEMLWECCSVPAQKGRWANVSYISIWI